MTRNHTSLFSENTTSLFSENDAYLFSGNTTFVKGDKYEINEIIYIEMYDYNPTNIIHKKFLVKYQPSNPENCKIMLDYRVRDGVKAPPDGWDSIPIRK